MSDTFSSMYDGVTGALSGVNSWLQPDDENTRLNRAALLLGFGTPLYAASMPGVAPNQRAQLLSQIAQLPLVYSQLQRQGIQNRRDNAAAAVLEGQTQRGNARLAEWQRAMGGAGAGGGSGGGAPAPAPSLSPAPSGLPAPTRSTSVLPTDAPAGPTDTPTDEENLLQYVVPGGNVPRAIRAVQQTRPAPAPVPAPVVPPPAPTSPFEVPAAALATTPPVVGDDGGAPGAPVLTRRILPPLATETGLPAGVGPDPTEALSASATAARDRDYTQATSRRDADLERQVTTLARAIFDAKGLIEGGVPPEDAVKQAAERAGADPDHVRRGMVRSLPPAMTAPAPAPAPSPVPAEVPANPAPAVTLDPARAAIVRPPVVAASPRPAPAPAGVSDEDDMGARLLLAEAGNQGPQGLAAVAHVINTRSRLSGETLPEVMQARSQFEPMGTQQGRARMAAIDPASPEYQQALAIFRGARDGSIPDPTNGATHFFAPRAQAQLGRDVPAWARGRDPLQIGDHNFYRISYGGGAPAPAPNPAPRGPAPGQVPPVPAAAPQQAPAEPTGWWTQAGIPFRLAGVIAQLPPAQQEEAIQRFALAQATRQPQARQIIGDAAGGYYELPRDGGPPVPVIPGRGNGDDRLNANQVIEREASFYSAFSRDPAVQHFANVQTNYRSFNGLENGPQSDGARIFMFQKALDSTGAVMEGDIRRIASAGGTTAAALQRIQREMGNGALSQQTRDEMGRIMSNLYDNASDAYGQTRERFVRQVSRYEGLNGERAIGEDSRPEEMRLGTEDRRLLRSSPEQIVGMPDTQLARFAPHYSRLRADQRAVIDQRLGLTGARTNGR